MHSSAFCCSDIVPNRINLQEERGLFLLFNLGVLKLASDFRDFNSWLKSVVRHCIMELEACEEKSSNCKVGRKQRDKIPIWSPSILTSSDQGPSANIPKPYYTGDQVFSWPFSLMHDNGLYYCIYFILFVLYMEGGEHSMHAMACA